MELSGIICGWSDMFWCICVVRCFLGDVGFENIVYLGNILLSAFLVRGKLALLIFVFVSLLRSRLHFVCFAVYFVAGDLMIESKM